MSVSAPDVFIPCTREIDIGDGVRYRPIRSWHSGTYAGEHLESVGGDSSGCVTKDPRDIRSFDKCYAPSTVTHRLYWHIDAPEHTVSAFLSYPKGMGSIDAYFWEATTGEDGPERFGDEAEMEARIRAAIRLDRQRRSLRGRVEVIHPSISEPLPSADGVLRYALHHQCRITHCPPGVSVNGCAVEAGAVVHPGDLVEYTPFVLERGGQGLAFEFEFVDDEEKSP